MSAGGPGARPRRQRERNDSSCAAPAHSRWPVRTSICSCLSAFMMSMSSPLRSRHLTCEQASTGRRRDKRVKRARQAAARRIPSAKAQMVANACRNAGRRRSCVALLLCSPGRTCSRARAPPPRPRAWWAGWESAQGEGGGTTSEKHTGTKAGRWARPALRAGGREAERERRQRRGDVRAGAWAPPSGCRPSCPRPRGCGGAPTIPRATAAARSSVHRPPSALMDARRGRCALPAPGHGALAVAVAGREVVGRGLLLDEGGRRRRRAARRARGAAHGRRGPARLGRRPVEQRGQRRLHAHTTVSDRRLLAVRPPSRGTDQSALEPGDEGLCDSSP